MDRRLGVSEVVTLKNDMTLLGTANNLVMSTELRRRTVPIRLNAAMERPETRPDSAFKHPRLIPRLREIRPMMIWSGLVFVKNWIQEGRPPGPSSMGSFESYTDVIGGILETAGVEGFLTNRDEWAEVTDLTSVGWSRFVELWWGQHSASPVKASDLIPLYSQVGDDFLFLGDSGERAQLTSLGRKLVSKQGAVIGGLRIVQGETSGGSSSWRLSEVAERER